MAIQVKSSGSSPILQSKSITPSSSTQTVYPSSGYDGLNSVTVNGDSNLIPSNIKNGINIFGIIGNLDSSSYKVYQTSFTISSATTNLIIPFNNLKAEEQIVFLYAGVVNGGIYDTSSLPTLVGAYAANMPNAFAPSGPSIFLKTLFNNNWIWETPSLGTLSATLQNNQCVFTTIYNGGQWPVSDDYGYWAFLVTSTS